MFAEKQERRGFGGRGQDDERGIDHGADRPDRRCGTQFPAGFLIIGDGAGTKIHVESVIDLSRVPVVPVVDLASQDEPCSESSEQAEEEHAVESVESCFRHADHELTVGGGVDVVVDAEGKTATVCELFGEIESVPLRDEIAAQHRAVAVDDSGGGGESADRVAVLDAQPVDGLSHMLRDGLQAFLACQGVHGDDGGMEDVAGQGRDGGGQGVPLDVEGDDETVLGGEAVQRRGPAGPRAR